MDGQVSVFSFAQRQHAKTRSVSTFLLFGMLLTSGFGIASAADSNLRFPGMMYDEETGLYYNGQRYYDPHIGQYTQPDRLGIDGGLNLYTYANSNPLTYIDPTGEYGIVGGAIGFGADIVLQLSLNGGRVECVDWGEAAIASALGAIGGGAFGGAFHLRGGSMKWQNVSRRYRRQHHVPTSFDVHHWAIPRRASIPDAVKNHPANLNPVPRLVHRKIHSQDSNPLYRWWHGTPRWAKTAEAGVVGFAAHAVIVDDCDDQCN